MTPRPTPSPDSDSTRWVLPFVAALVAMFTMQLSNLGFSPLLPSIQQDFGISFTQLGLFTGIYGLLAMALSVPAGLAATRFGEKRVLMVGLIGIAAGSVLLGQARSFEAALAARGATIAGYRFAFVSVLVAVAVTAPLRLRGRTMGVVGAVSSLASVIGAPLGGLLVREAGWRTAILGYAGMAAVGASAIAALYRPRPGVASDQTSGHATPTFTGSAFRTPMIWLLALVVGLGGFGQFTVTYFVPSVARAVFGLDAAAAGLIISSGYLTAMAANLVIGYLADRYDKLLVLSLVFVVLTVASASLAIEHQTVFRIGTALVIGFGFSAANQLYALAGSVMSRREAANAMGIVGLGAGLFGYFGPQMIGYLRDRTGSFVAGFYMVAACDLATLVLLLTMSRQRRRSPARLDS